MHRGSYGSSPTTMLAVDRPNKSDSELIIITYTQAHKDKGRIKTLKDRTVTKDMRIGTINIGTLRGKEEEIVDIMEKKKWSIMGMGETRYKKEGSKVIHNNYQLFYKGKDHDTKHGVGIIVTPEVSSRVEKVFYLNERIIGIRLNMGKTRCGIIQVYAPQQGRSNEEKDRFYEDLQDIFDNMNCRENTIIMGDMNGHVGCDRQGIRSVIGEFSIGDRNEAGERVIDFCVRNGMAIMNTFFKHRESHKWTWYMWEKQREMYTRKSMIDFIMVTDKKCVMDVKAIPSMSLDGDHRMVVAKLKMKQQVIKLGKKTKRYRVEKLNDTEVKEEFRQKLSGLIKEETQTEELNSGQMWEAMKRQISKVADETLGVKYTGGKKKKCTPWWNEEVKEAVKVKMKAFRRWMRKKTDVMRLEYVIARREAEKVKRKAKEAIWTKLGEKLEADYGGGKKLLYSLAKGYRKGQQEQTHNVKDKKGELLTDEGKIEDRWREYFSDLLNVMEEREEQIRDEEVNINNGQAESDRITEEEIRKELKHMKNGKSPGEDGLTAELYKEGGEELIKSIIVLFNKVWDTGEVPKEWGRAIICPIFKAGDRQDCKNYRGISLLTHISKLYERILEKRLRKSAEKVLGEWQYGFRPGRSTMDLIFTIKIIMEKAWEWDVDQYMAFLDLEKAFDRIPRNKLWKVLEEEEYGVSRKLLKAITSLYDTCESKVQNGKWFQVNCGVRQGSALSPLLFIIYMDKIVKDVGRRNVDESTALSYADDVAIIAKSEEILKRTVAAWNEELHKYGMKLNVRKSEVMVLSRMEKKCEIIINNQQLKEVDSFKYLGVHYNNTGVMEREIDERIAKYSKNVGLLYPLLREKEIPKKVKATIYTTILRPIMLYGCDAWVLTTKLRSKIQAAEMRVLRLIMGTTRRDKIRNDVIREKLQVESVLNYVEKRQLIWYGHLQRMEDNRYPKKFYGWKPGGKRPVGRPRMRWKQNIDAAVIKRGSTIREVEEMQSYKERSVWRSFCAGSNVQLTGISPNRRKM